MHVFPIRIEVNLATSSVVFGSTSAGIRQAGFALEVDSKLQSVDPSL